MSEELNEIPEVEAEVVEYTSPILSVEDGEEEGEYVEVKEEYGEVEKEVVYLDPITGEQLDPNNLGPFEKIKFIANQLGQTIDEPTKNCPHCYGRGYTSVDAKNGLPTACSCIYKTYRKANPDWAQTVRPAPNRKMKRAQSKQMSKLIQRMKPAYEKDLAIKEASRAGLGKNTPGYVAKEFREAYNEANGISNVCIDLDDVTLEEVPQEETHQIETVEGVIGKVD